MPSEATLQTLTLSPIVRDPLDLAKEITSRATEIRRRATRAYHREIKPIGFDTGPLGDAFTLMRYLRPGQVEAAIFCHRTLVKEARRDLQRGGFTGEWVQLALSLFNFLEASGWRYENTRWITFKDFLALRAKA